jgi:hypothetical protein
MYGLKPVPFKAEPYSSFSPSCEVMSCYKIGVPFAFSRKLSGPDF